MEPHIVACIITPARTQHDVFFNFLSIDNILFPHTSSSFFFQSSSLNSCPSASLDYIIEPWFLGAGSEGPGGPEFNEWAAESTSKYGTVFGTSVGELPDPKQPRCALISGRTADNPRLFKECIDAKCSTIFLEKPGAPTVSFVYNIYHGGAVKVGHNFNVCGERGGGINHRPNIL
jgi:hypothetical protein